MEPVGDRGTARGIRAFSRARVGARDPFDRRGPHRRGPGRASHRGPSIGITWGRRPQSASVDRADVGLHDHYPVAVIAASDRVILAHTAVGGGVHLEMLLVGLALVGLAIGSRKDEALKS